MRSYNPPFILKRSNISKHEKFPYLRLECFVFSKFIPNYVWYDGEIQLENDGNFLADCCDYGNGKYMCYLLIKRFDKTYNAIYKCIIKNKYGKCYAYFDIKKNDMFYPDIIPGKLIDNYVLNPTMVWKVSMPDCRFRNFQWYWNDKNIYEYGTLFKSLILKYGNTNVIETQLMIQNPRINIFENLIHCLLSDINGKCTTSYTFYSLPPLNNNLSITDDVNIIVKKMKNNKIYVGIIIKYNTTSEPIVKWYNRYGYKYECDENHCITNIQEDENGNYVASLYLNEYTTKTTIIVCKIKNNKVDCLVSIDTVAIEKKIFDLELMNITLNESK
ncbi:Immunoglobulin-like fold domain-containing protein [Strongyloides ratti]|uniref:Immunoglobulin-like fold domain-containing protein n=1 Tax=Strongyloides ratti TaxID=34506 RepID=A0A090L4Q7_STRRB|nr:Immunoglobulin-like fold domain-containing protein [Strongyloides ratti]CEF64682.1 Immunoglobulin-like fold domain-containing protein [Strongyloides ratti]